MVSQSLQATRVQFAAHLNTPRLAWLCQHVVNGQPLLPGAAFLEALGATVHMLSIPGSNMDLLLHDISIRMPLILDEAHSLLSIDADMETGTLHVASSKGVHVTASVGVLPNPQSSSPAPLLAYASTLHQAATAMIAAPGAYEQDSNFLLPPGMLDSSMQLGQVFVRDHSSPVVPV